MGHLRPPLYLGTRCREVSSKKSRCRWGTTCNCNVSCCQNVIAPLSWEHTSTVTRLSAHVADEFEEVCDGSFHARLHTRLLRCGAVPSAPPHNVLCRPKFSRNTIVRLIRSWSSVPAKKRVASLKEFIFRLKVLHLEIQFLEWGKEGGENW